MRRRAFLIGSGVVAAASALFAYLRRTPGYVEPATKPVAGKPVVQQVLPDRYLAVLRALVARLYPDAVIAKAANYIESELQRPNMQNTRRLILNGCVQLDRVAMGQLKHGFADLEPADQDLVIAAVQSGNGAPKSFNGEDFIAAAVAMTIEGVFSDPIYGGNADEVGWRSIGWVMQTPRPVKS